MLRQGSIRRPMVTGLVTLGVGFSLTSCHAWPAIDASPPAPLAKVSVAPTPSRDTPMNTPIPTPGTHIEPGLATPSFWTAPIQSAESPQPQVKVASSRVRNSPPAKTDTTASGKTASNSKTSNSTRPPASHKSASKRRLESIGDVRVFRNCAELTSVYPHGVGRTDAEDLTKGKKKRRPVTNFHRDNALYQANSSRDADGDGVACER